MHPVPLMWGDINGDGKIDDQDVKALVSVYNQSADANINADSNGDGKIDLLDFRALALNLNKTQSPWTE